MRKVQFFKGKWLKLWTNFKNAIGNPSEITDKPIYKINNDHKSRLTEK